MDKNLLNLPWQIQLSLGSGYLAYLIAYAGIRQHHTATDAIFRTVAFGLAATAVLLWAPLEHGLLEIAALASALATGALWRWKGMAMTKTALGVANVTWSDDIPSAWLSITAMRTDVRPSQIAVDLDNGRTLVCDDTRRFAKAPYGPCVFGLDGSVALYVTAEMRPDNTWLEKLDVEHPFDGPRLTYIPASAIKRVEMRLWTRANEKAALGAVPVAGEVEEPEESGAEPSQEYKSDGPPT